MDAIYLLDTNVVSALEKAHSGEAAKAFVASLAPSQVRLPLSAVFEIQYGVELCRSSHPVWAREKERWLDSLLASGIPIVCPSVEIIRLRAQMAATNALRSFFFPRPGAKKIKFGEDILIAATAIAERTVVATFDIDDFLAIRAWFPLPGIYHPGRQEWVVGPNAETSARSAVR